MTFRIEVENWLVTDYQRSPGHPVTRDYAAYLVTHHRDLVHSRGRSQRYHPLSVAQEIASGAELAAKTPRPSTGLGLRTNSPTCNDPRMSAYPESAWRESMTRFNEDGTLTDDAAAPPLLVPTPATPAPDPGIIEDDIEDSFDDPIPAENAARVPTLPPIDVPLTNEQMRAFTDATVEGARRIFSTTSGAMGRGSWIEYATYAARTIGQYVIEVPQEQPTERSPDAEPSPSPDF